MKVEEAVIAGASALNSRRGVFGGLPRIWDGALCRVG